GEYSQWSERFMNYLEEQMDEEAMIHSIKNGDQPLPTVTQVSIAGATSMINDLKKCGYSKDNCELNFKFLNNLQPEWKHYATMMRQNKNLLDINIDALYNILKQNQGDVNDAMKSNKKAVVITSNLLALVAEQTKVTKRKDKVVVSSESEGNDKKEEKKVDEKKRDISKVKCYNFKKEGHFAKDYKKTKVKDYEYYKTKMLLAKKDKDEQVLLAEDHAWMESSSVSDQEINANKVFMAQLEKVLSDFEKSSSSLNDTIAECMRTRNSYFLNNSSATIPRRQNKRRTPKIVKPELYTIVEMTDNCKMEELLQVPTEGDVPNNVIKLMMFPYSLEENARVWDNASKSDDRIDKLADQISTLVDIFAKKIVTPALVKAVEESCVTCGGAHAYYNFTSSPELDVLKTLPKPNIPYPSRLNDQKLREKATNQMEKFFQIFQDLHFDISFADALLLMPKFASTIKSLLTNKDKFFELAKIPLNENCSAMLLKNLPKNLGDSGKFLIPCDFPGMDVCHALADLGASINLMPLSIWKKLSLPKLTPTWMTLELADISITRPKGVAKDVFIKVEKSFLRTVRALIDVYGEGITLWVNDEAVTFNLNQTTRYSSSYDDLSVNRIDIINVAREEYAQKILVKAKSSIEEPPELELKELPSHLEYAYLEERLAGNEFYYLLGGFSGYIQIPINPPNQEKTTFTCPYGTFAYRRMPFGLCNAPGTFQMCMMAIFHDMIEKTIEVFMDDFLKKCHFMVKHGIFLGHKIYKNGLEVDRSKLDVIAKLPYPTTVKGVRSFLGHAGFYRRFIQDFSKIARPMTHLLEKDTLFVFSKDYIDDFETLKRKLTEASILVVIDWNLPFELMCDASDFAIGAILGQRKTKHFQPIHYASMTMTEAQIYYTMTEKEMIAIVYAFEKFRPYLVLSKSIVYTDHSALKYLLSVCMAKKLLISSKLVMKDPPGDIMVPISPSRKDEMPQNVIQVCKIFDVWAKALPTNDARVVVKFLKSLFARFGTPKAIISDCGTHFCNDKFAKVMSKYGVTHRLSTAYHPQTSGQVEVSNRGLMRILERTIGENRASWSKKLDDALWAFRTAYKTPIGFTPYKLVYGKSCHLPIELEHKAYYALKHVNFDLKTTGDHRKLQLNELNELREQAYENSLIYKEKTKKIHDSKIKNRILNIGDRVLLFNYYLKIFTRKLKTRWSGPFTITKVVPYGTVELSQSDGLNLRTLEGITTVGSPRSPDFPHRQMNAGIESS
nr:hypothetical protein [Tanacetum cinerariifolium]